jgi:hypothetical protein
MSKKKLLFYSKVLLAILVTFPGLILANDSDKLRSIGRGTKLTLIKDIEIPANQNYIDFPVLKVNGPQSEFLNWTVYTYVCRLELKESSLDRRVLSSGTTIILSGEYEEDTHAAEPYGTVQGLIIQSPSALQGISCGGYAQVFHQTTYGMTSPAGNAYGPIEFTIENFKALFASYWRIERPDPVVIHNR